MRKVLAFITALLFGLVGPSLAQQTLINQAPYTSTSLVDTNSTSNSTSNVTTNNTTTSTTNNTNNNIQSGTVTNNNVMSGSVTYTNNNVQSGTLTKRINGGTIGLEDRKKHYEHCLHVLAH